MHGGEVSAESAGIGRGATFRVRLPLQGIAAELDDLRPAPSVEDDVSPWSRASFGGALILVVDDDPSTRELLTVVLTRCDARVVAAGSAAAAFDALQREVPALVVADIGMPGEDGLSLMRRIRALPAGRGGRVPALALSAYARGEDKERARQSGFDEFLAKPAAPADVVRSVERLLGDGAERSAGERRDHGAGAGNDW